MAMAGWHHITLFINLCANRMRIAKLLADKAMRKGGRSDRALRRFAGCNISQPDCGFSSCGKALVCVGSDARKRALDVPPALWHPQGKA
jgi:hypothetical protein